jgi:hypothetical protein
MTQTVAGNKITEMCTCGFTWRYQTLLWLWCHSDLAHTIPPQPWKCQFNNYCITERLSSALIDSNVTIFVYLPFAAVRVTVNGPWTSIIAATSLRNLAHVLLIRDKSATTITQRTTLQKKTQYSTCCIMYVGVPAANDSGCTAACRLVVHP